MDFKKIEKLVELARRHELEELEVEENKARVKIVMKRGAGQGSVAYAAVTPQQSIGNKASSEAKTQRDPSKEIRSPFVGTYYEAAKPGAQAFVREGQRVKKGDTLCIIEAMKIMNEIEADRDGQIAEILISNGQAVAYDQVLFVLQ